jgi:hypothetical protein
LLFSRVVDTRLTRRPGHEDDGSESRQDIYIGITSRIVPALEETVCP